MMAAYPVERLIDLPRFLFREHPGHGNEVQAEAARTGTLAIRVLSGDDAQAQMANIREKALFYNQGRVFADFLIDRTGNPAVFGAIGEAFGRGETFEVWLAANGGALGLAATVPELDLQWRAWLETRFGRTA